MRTKQWLAALAWGALGTWAQAQSLPGDYLVEGRDVAGKPYAGKLTIAAAGPVFRLTYTDGNTLRGMGILRGNQLFTAWGPSNKCTVSALEIKTNGDLEGAWGDLAQNSLGTEALKKQAGAGGQVDGTYASTGRTPQGESYDGITTVQTRGQVLRFSFKDSDGTQNGVGILQGQAVAVAYGGAKCGVSVYTVGADGNLSGPYAEPGDNRLGVETIRKAR